MKTIKATKLLSIGKLAKLANMTTVAIRYYEKMGLIAKVNISRSENGYRYYRAETIQLLGFIKNAKLAGLSLTDILNLQLLQLKDAPDSHHIKKLITQKINVIDEKITALHEIKVMLKKLDMLCDGKSKARNCPILQALARNQVV